MQARNLIKMAIANKRKISGKSTHFNLNKRCKPVGSAMLLSLSTGNEFSYVCVIFFCLFGISFHLGKKKFVSRCAILFWFNSIWSTTTRGKCIENLTTKKKILNENHRKQIEYATREKYTHNCYRKTVRFYGVTYVTNDQSNEKKANKMAKVCLF